MGKPIAIALLTTLFSGMVTVSCGAAQDDAKTTVIPASSSLLASPTPPRPEPPVAPRKYLETGARLFNKGRYDLAAKYLEAAQLYRDRLTSNERTVLDIYREKFDAYSKAPITQPQIAETLTTGPRDAEVKAVSTASRPPEILASMSSKGTAAVLSPSNPFAGEQPQVVDAPFSNSLSGTLAGRDTTDTKQKARWLLQIARDQLLRREFDAAERSIAEARTLSVKWGLFDETPDKLAAAVTKARAKNPTGKSARGITTTGGSSAGLEANAPHDRRTARNLLREARTALGAGQTERAESIVREVRNWDIRYSLLDDTPEKLSVAISEARRREASRSADLMVRSYLGSTTRSGEPVDEEIRPRNELPAQEIPGSK